MTLLFQNLNAQPMVVTDSDILAQTTARLLVKAFSEILARKERVLFIPSSGSTPLKTYCILAKQYRDAIDWSRITIIQMDEYWTRSINRDAYFHSYLRKDLMEPLGVGRFISMQKSGKMSKAELYTP